MKLHLAIDAVGIKHSGGATVLRDFLAAAIDDARFRKITIFCSPRRARNFDLPDSAKIAEIEVPKDERSRSYRLLWFERGLLQGVRREQADVLLCMSGAGRAPRKIPQVTFIQQSLPFYSEACKLLSLREQLRIKMILLMSRRACRWSRTVLVQTPTMRRHVMSRFGISGERVKAFLPSVNALPGSIAASRQLEAMRAAPRGRRLLYVGNQSPYKNVESIAVAMARVRAQLPETTLFLTWPENHPLARIEGVKCCGYLNGSALREAYTLATLVVMPSLAETVGLPMLEAMSVGAPVLAADRSYAHDICGAAAAYFDPLDSEDFAAKAVALLSDEAALRQLSQQGIALIEQRRASKPYERILDAVLQAAAAPSV